MKRYYGPIRRYLQKAWTLLPCSFKEKRTIISMLSKTLSEYIVLNPTASYEVLTEHFGEPEEVMRSYVTNTDSSAIIKKWRLRKNLSYTLLALVASVLIVLCITTPNDKQDYEYTSNRSPMHTVKAIKTSDKVSEIDEIEDHINAYNYALSLANSAK